MGSLLVGLSATLRDIGPPKFFNARWRDTTAGVLLNSLRGAKRQGRQVPTWAAAKASAWHGYLTSLLARARAAVADVAFPLCCPRALSPCAAALHAGVGQQARLGCMALELQRAFMMHSQLVSLLRAGRACTRRWLAGRKAKVGSHHGTIRARACRQTVP